MAQKKSGEIRVGCVCGQETEETDSETYGRCAVGELESIRSSENPADPLIEGGIMGEEGAGEGRSFHSWATASGTHPQGGQRTDERYSPEVEAGGMCQEIRESR